MRDPRACSIPMTEFNHLTLGEVDEEQRLWRKLASEKLTPDESRRLVYLSGRRRRVHDEHSKPRCSVSLVECDVSATIRYWQNTGVTVAMVAQQLRCHADWSTVREVMIAWAADEDAPRRLAA